MRRVVAQGLELRGQRLGRIGPRGLPGGWQRIELGLGARLSEKDGVEALGDELARGGQFGSDTQVRHLVGVDPQRGLVAVADSVRMGMRLAFCGRDAQAARRDLVRICSEIRDELEAQVGDHAMVAPSAGDLPPAASQRIAGALYISCAGRGGPHFGAPSAEAQIIRHALGDVPLAGFFAAGEIARHHLYGYTGVLTVFVTE